MPRSRSRHKHPHGHHPAATHEIAHKPKRKAAFVMSLLGAVMGAVIALIASDSQVLWILVGATIGLVAGYFLGKGIDKSTARK